MKWLIFTRNKNTPWNFKRWEWNKDIWTVCFLISCFLFSVKTFMSCFCRPDFSHISPLRVYCSPVLWILTIIFKISVQKLLFSSEASLLKELSCTNQHQMAIQLTGAEAKLGRRHKAAMALPATTRKIFKDSYCRSGGCSKG